MIQSVVDSVVSYRRNFSETCGGQTFFLFLSVPLSLLVPSYHNFRWGRWQRCHRGSRWRVLTSDRNLVKTRTAVEPWTLGRNHAARWNTDNHAGVCSAVLPSLPCHCFTACVLSMQFGIFFPPKVILYLPLCYVCSAVFPFHFLSPNTSVAISFFGIWSHLVNKIVMRLKNMQNKLCLAIICLKK